MSFPRSPGGYVGCVVVYFLLHGTRRRCEAQGSRRSLMLNVVTVCSRESGHAEAVETPEGQG